MLNIEIKNQNIKEVTKGDLSLYIYTNKCVYNSNWNKWNILARGLILDKKRKRIVATPFPKFFNYEEVKEVPNLPFEVYEKVDGSLGIAYRYEEKWHIATKGAFDSPQAIWGTEKLRRLDTSTLEPDTTYLFEIVSKANRVVVRYPYEGLVLLGGYKKSGVEISYSELVTVSSNLDIRMAEKIESSDIFSVLEKAKSLGKEAEGFVIRFANGERIKIKGEEYKRIHRLIIGVTPLAIWEILKNGEDLESYRKEIPEEFWEDFDTIATLLKKQYDKLIDEVELYHVKFKDSTDKEIGLVTYLLPELVSSFIFLRRKNKEWYNVPKTKDRLFLKIKPSGNVLEGYSTGIQLED
jgi:RNA ligase